MGSLYSVLVSVISVELTICATQWYNTQWLGFARTGDIRLKVTAKMVNTYRILCVHVFLYSDKNV